MEFQDYYKLLDVDKNATDDQIKKQYRRLARKYHPDVSKEANAEEKFKQVKEAYEVLKDAEKRKAYDQFGQNWKQGQGFEPPPNWNYQQSQSQGGHQQSQFNGEDYSDFFENLFGQRGAGFRQQRPKASRGQDQHSKVSISLEDAYKGTTRQLSLQQPTSDPRTGQVRYSTRSLNVKIPAGVKQGQQIRLKGQGSEGFGGGPKGDLYLEVTIAASKLFCLDGKNISVTLPITPWEAALGSKIAVPTLGGKVDLSIPANSQSGQKLRLKGRGLPGKTAGDQFVTLKIVTPKAQTDEQRELYQRMAESMPFNPRADMEV